MRFSCLVQEQSYAYERRADLERRLDEHHRGHYPGDATSVSWHPVPRGHMYTEGRQSTSSIIACALEHATTLDQREQYMRGICDLWTDVTGCTDHEIVVSITEVDPTTGPRQ